MRLTELKCLLNRRGPMPFTAREVVVLSAAVRIMERLETGAQEPPTTPTSANT